VSQCEKNHESCHVLWGADSSHDSLIRTRTYRLTNSSNHLTPRNLLFPMISNLPAVPLCAVFSAKALRMSPVGAVGGASGDRARELAGAAHGRWRRRRPAQSAGSAEIFGFGGIARRWPRSERNSPRHVAVTPENGPWGGAKDQQPWGRATWWGRRPSPHPGARASRLGGHDGEPPTKRPRRKRQRSNALAAEALACASVTLCTPGGWQGRGWMG
jgi:hypothetical protein